MGRTLRTSLPRSIKLSRPVTHGYSYFARPSGSSWWSEAHFRCYCSPFYPSRGPLAPLPASCVPGGPLAGGGPPSAKVRFSIRGGCELCLFLQPMDSAVFSLFGKVLLHSGRGRQSAGGAKPGRLSDTKVTSRRRKSASAGTWDGTGRSCGWKPSEQG